MARMPEFKNDFVIDAKIYNKSLSLDELVARSKNDLAGFEPHFISLPFMQGANIRLFGYVKDQNFLHNEYSSILTYDKNNGELVSILDIKNANLSEKILSAFRKSHFGNYNQFAKFIWFLVGISPLILSISGLYLWIKRNFKRRKNEKIFN